MGGGIHGHGLVAKFLVVIVDFGDTLHSVVLQGLIQLLVCVCHMPTKDVLHKGGDEHHCGLGTEHGLGQGEVQHQDAEDTVLLFKLLSSLNSLPH